MLGKTPTRLTVLICAAFAAVALGLVLSVPQRPAEGVLVLDRADEAVFATIAGTPLGREGDIRLSQNWSTGAPHSVRAARETVEGHYRLGFEAAGPAMASSLMIPRVAQAVRIEINGALIHDDYDDGALNRWDWYSPVVADIPDGVLRPGVNDMALTLTAAPGTVAGLSLIFLGERDAIERIGARLNFLQKTLPTYANLSVIVLSIPLLLIWLHGRGEAGRPFRIYGLLAAASILFALRSLHVHVGEPPVPHHLWLFLVMASLGWALGFFYSFLLHFVGAGSARIDRALAVFVAAGALLLFFTPSARLAELGPLFWYVPLTVVGAVCVAVVCLKTLRAPDSARIGLSLSLLMLLAAGIHDVLWARGVLSFESLLWMPIVMPAVLLVISAAIANRFVAAWMAAEALNRNLAARVREAEAEIANAYERRLEAERREALAVERARLVEDLHDGVGSRLSVLLAAWQTAAVPRERTIEVLRDCLGDLKMIISARDQRPLGDALAEYCGQLGGLLEARGVDLRFDVAPEAGALNIGSRKMLNLLRFVQEACANAARHGRGDWIGLECGFHSPGVLRIAVSDGGAPRADSGFAPASSGRGMRTMKARAARLGAAMSIDRGTEGWRVTLDMPVAAPVPAAPEKPRFSVFAPGAYESVAEAAAE